jgi:hypothetical protein
MLETSIGSEWIEETGGRRFAQRVSESLDDEGMDFCGGKGIGGRNMGEA